MTAPGSRGHADRGRPALKMTPNEHTLLLMLDSNRIHEIPGFRDASSFPSTNLEARRGSCPRPSFPRAPEGVVAARSLCPHSPLTPVMSFPVSVCHFDYLLLEVQPQGSRNGCSLCPRCSSRGCPCAHLSLSPLQRPLHSTCCAINGSAPAAHISDPSSSFTSHHGGAQILTSLIIY